MEVFSHHSHNGVGFFVESDRASDDLRVSSEASPPQTVAQNDDLISAGLAILRSKGSPQGGRRSQCGEETGGDKGSGQPLRLRSVSQIEVTRSDGHQMLQSVILLSQV